MCLYHYLSVCLVKWLFFFSFLCVLICAQILTDFFFNIFLVFHVTLSDINEPYYCYHHYFVYTLYIDSMTYIIIQIPNVEKVLQFNKNR